MKLNENTGVATFKSTLQNYNNEFNGRPPCTVRRIPKEELEMFIDWVSRPFPLIEIVCGDLSFCRRVSAIEDITWMFPEVVVDRVYKIAWHHGPRDARIDELEAENAKLRETVNEARRILESQRVLEWEISGRGSS